MHLGILNDITALLIQTVFINLLHNILMRLLIFNSCLAFLCNFVRVRNRRTLIKVLLNLSVEENLNGFVTLVVLQNSLVLALKPSMLCALIGLGDLNAYDLLLHFGCLHSVDIFH